METTVEDITEAADVGKGTFFNYFRTKEHVLATFGAERLASIDRALERAKKGPVMPVLRDVATDLAGQNDGESCPASGDLCGARLVRAGARRIAQAASRRRGARWRKFSRSRRSEAKCGAIFRRRSWRGWRRSYCWVCTLAWALHPDSSLRVTTAAGLGPVSTEPACRWKTQGREASTGARERRMLPAADANLSLSLRPGRLEGHPR